MQIKINFLCRDSILAAPLALDLVLLADWRPGPVCAARRNWLSLYFKNPTVKNGRQIHELFAQRQMWENEIRRLAGWTVQRAIGNLSRFCRATSKEGSSSSARFEIAPPHI